MINGSKVDVYASGAGASAHVGAPLTRDFLLEGFSLLPFSYTYNVPMQQFRIVARLMDRLCGSGLKKYSEEALDDTRRPSEIPPISAEDLHPSWI